MASNRKKRMANRGQQPVQVNGLYVHASPPKVVQMNPSVMRQWLRGGDLDKLEQVVLEGQGSRLVGEYSADPKTRAFIRSVPSLLTKIDAAHAATTRGQLTELQDLIASERRIQLALAKDRSGVGLLHKAVFQDHGNIIAWLIQAYPATVNSKDREGRSPLHYCGAGSDAQYTWRILIEAGADPQQSDVRGRVPAYYMDNPDDLRLPASPADSEEIRRIAASREGFIVKPSNIRIWIHDQDLGRLKQVLWEGHGNRLRTETSKYPAVKRFLDSVPYAMNAIRDTHAAAISGDREAFQNRTAEPAPVDLILSKDINGLTPLHKSAGLGNVGVTDDILRRAPRATVITDNLGRTPLHYSVLLKDQGEMYNTLIREGADELAVDNLGRTAEYYRGRPGDLDASLLRNIPEAPRTSSTFPPSWDWNILATDGPISNQTSGASRRLRKTSRTSGATRSDGGSPLNDAASVNGPVNGQAATDEEQPKIIDDDVVVSTDNKPSEIIENDSDNGRLDSQTSSAADKVLEEQQARVISELFPEFQMFLRRLSDLEEMYERAGLKEIRLERSAIQVSNFPRENRVIDRNMLTVPDIRIDSSVSAESVFQERNVTNQEIVDGWENDENNPFHYANMNGFRIPSNNEILRQRPISAERRRQGTEGDHNRRNSMASSGTESVIVSDDSYLERSSYSSDQVEDSGDVRFSTENDNVIESSDHVELVAQVAKGHSNYEAVRADDTKETLPSNWIINASDELGINSLTQDDNNDIDIDGGRDRKNEEREVSQQTERDVKNRAERFREVLNLAESNTQEEAWETESTGIIQSNNHMISNEMAQNEETLQPKTKDDINKTETPNKISDNPMLNDSVNNAIEQSNGVRQETASVAIQPSGIESRIESGIDETEWLDIQRSNFVERIQSNEEILPINEINSSEGIQFNEDTLKTGRSDLRTGYIRRNEEPSRLGEMDTSESQNPESHQTVEISPETPSRNRIEENQTANAIIQINEVEMQIQVGEGISNFPSIQEIVALEEIVQSNEQDMVMDSEQSFDHTAGNQLSEEAIHTTDERNDNNEDANYRDKKPIKSEEAMRSSNENDLESKKRNESLEIVKSDDEEARSNEIPEGNVNVAQLNEDVVIKLESSTEVIESNKEKQTKRASPNEEDVGSDGMLEAPVVGDGRQIVNNQMLENNDGKESSKNNFGRMNDETNQSNSKPDVLEIERSNEIDLMVQSNEKETTPSMGLANETTQSNQHEMSEITSREPFVSHEITSRTELALPEGGTLYIGTSGGITTSVDKNGQSIIEEQFWEQNIENGEDIGDGFQDDGEVTLNMSRSSTDIVQARSLQNNITIQVGDKGPLSQDVHTSDINSRTIAGSTDNFVSASDKQVSIEYIPIQNTSQYNNTSAQTIVQETRSKTAAKLSETFTRPIIKINETQFDKEGLGDVQETRSSEFQDDSPQNAFSFFETPNGPSSIIDKSIGEFQGKNETVLLVSDNVYSLVVVNNEINDTRGVKTKEQNILSQAEKNVHADQDSNEAINNSFSRTSLDIEDPTTGVQLKEQDSRITNQEVSGSSANGTSALNVHEGRDNSADNGSVSVNYKVNYDPLPSLAPRDKDAEENTRDRRSGNDLINTSIVNMNWDVALGREFAVLSSVQSDADSFQMEVHSEQLQSVAEETNGRIEEEELQEKKNEEENLEPTQSDDGNGVSPSGLPDETPLRDQPEPDGVPLDDEVPATPTDTGEPANNDGDSHRATNGSGDVDQSAESDDVNTRPKTANEKQEQASNNGDSVNDPEPDVKDEALEEVISDGDVLGEIRPKRSVDDNKIDEDPSINNKTNDISTGNISLADDNPTEDISKHENVPSNSNIKSVQDILTNNDVSRNNNVSTANDILPTDDISTMNNVPTTDDVPTTEEILPTDENKTINVPTTDDVPTTVDILPPDVILPTEDNSTTINIPTTDDIPTDDVPTIENVPLASDTPENKDGLSSEDIDSIQDIIKSGVTDEGESPSGNKIDIPSVQIDPGSADENQDDDGRDEEVAQSVNDDIVLPSNIKIPNGDVTHAEVTDVDKDPANRSKETEEDSHNGADQEIDVRVDEESNEINGNQSDITNAEVPESSDNREENDNVNINENIAVAGKQEDDAKGDGDDNNNNDVEEMDKEAPGTPDSNDVVSEDRSSDENDEDTSDRKKGGDPSGGSRIQCTNSADGQMDPRGNMEHGVEGSNAGDKENSGVGADTPDNSEPIAKAEAGSSTMAGVGSNVGTHPKESSSGKNSSFGFGESSPGYGENSGVGDNPEGSSGVVAEAEETSGVTVGAEEVSGTDADAEDNSGAGVSTDADETPRQVGNGRIPHAETESQSVGKTNLSKKLSFRGITHRVLNGLSRRQKSDATQETIEIPIEHVGQDKTSQDGEIHKGEGLSNATTAIIGAQSSPDTINTDDFQETDSRYYRSSRRPQTPLPVASTVLAEEDEDEGVIGDQDEEIPKGRGLENGDEARHLQGRVIGERNMENQAAASNMVKGGINRGGAVSSPPKPDPEVDRLIARGDLSALAELVLNGEGGRLIGRRSEMPELQSFIENVPTYMAKIQSVHDSARNGQLRELQAALDRRKFAVARDPRTPAGATPLHAAVLLGQTAVVRYLAGRFPETLAARDARGRAPLHCAAALPDNGHYFNLLLNLGADRTLKDNNGRTASYYLQNPGILTHKQLLADINAPESIADESFSDKVPYDEVSSRRRVVNDPELANTMDKYFQVIQEAAVDAKTDNRSIRRMVVLKFLTKHIFDQCKYLLTRMDHGILNVIWPVILDQSRSVEDRLKQSGTFFEEAGIVLPDYESYFVFSVIVMPVVKFLNGMDPKQPILPHPPSQFFEDTEEEVSSVGTTVSVLSKMELRNDEATQRSMDLDPSRKMILHSVAHCTRNLEDFNLPLCLTLDDLRQVERYLRRALLTGKSPYEVKENGYEWDDLVLSDDEGTYYPLEELSDPLHDIRAKLRSAGQWLEQQGDPDRSMRLHGKYWPLGRGVFVTKDGSIAAYINVQDHLRVMVAAKEGQAGKIGSVYRNLGEFMNKLDNIFRFKKDDVLGHLAARPWVCGNTMRFKVTVRLPKLGREPEHLIALCKSRSLRLAPAASLDVFHFSNRQCLGITEVQTYRSFVTAVANILQLEHRMEANGLHFGAILGKLFRKRHLAEANAVR